MNFYEFNQNNSGGSFEVNDKVCHRVIIEATDATEANYLAERLGIYFNGCDRGMDCSCCGDRWSEAWGDGINLEKMNERGYEVNVYSHYDHPEAKWLEKYGKYNILEKPKWRQIYSSRSYEGKITFKDIEEYIQFLANEWGYKPIDARIYYKNGTVKEIMKED